MKSSLFFIVLAALVAVALSLPSGDLYRRGKGKTVAPKPVAAPKAVAPAPKAVAPAPKAAAPGPKAAAPGPKTAAPGPKAAAPGPKAAAPKAGGNSGGTKGGKGEKGGGGSNNGGKAGGSSSGSGSSGSGSGNSDGEGRGGGGGSGKVGPKVNYPATQSLNFNPPSSAAPRPTGSVCNGITGGTSACVPCVKNAACGFDLADNKCKPRVAGLVTSATACQQAGTSANTRTTVDNLFNAMRNHIFIGETTGNPQSGRHTFSSWTEVNSDAGRCDTGTHLCAFRLPRPGHTGIPKTIWDDRPGTYTQADIETMCKTVISLNMRATGSASRDGAFVVQTKFNKPICVRHQVARPGSCFPVGIHFRTAPIGSACSETNRDTQPIQGVNEEIPARSR